jgi:GT2 family glycosyltransferase
MIGNGVIDAGLPPSGFEFAGADRWHVLVLYRGAPAARVDLPSPGAVRGPALGDAVLRRRSDDERARGELIGRLRERLGAPPEAEADIAISVVVCTHRRPAHIAQLLGALGRLDPAPVEIVIVDNDPGDLDCRAPVEAAGFTYLREDRRGLDNARNAGLRAARGEVVAFVDDDCVVPPGWLAPLRRAFARRSVAAVTGPAFPYLLDTPARIRMEEQASLARGLRRESFDWLTISPLHAAAMGIGANMAFRRDRIDGRAGPFPAELDAGTETESGGDTYVLSRVLAAGDRVVYEPRSFIFHQHRDDWAALSRAVLGYGIGLSAALTKLVVEDRELSAPRAWAWLPKQYLRTQRRRWVGRADATNTRISWDYLRGGFLGGARWRRALRTQAAAGRSSASRALPAPPVAGDTVPPVAGSLAPPAAGGPPPSVAEVPAPPAPVGPSPAARSVRAEAAPPASLRISVVVPTFRREAQLARCLAALAAQDIDPAEFEVIVVDDDRDGPGGPLPGGQANARRVRNPGRGAAAARNHGAGEARADLVLFVDDDVVADPWLLRSHLDWHRERGADAVLIGPYLPAPVRPGFAAAIARLWWFDFFEALAEAPSPTFVAALSANMSLPIAAFEAVGGFAEDVARQRREDWEWGLRARRAGLPIEFCEVASARHEYALETRQRVRDARREGFGDALIVARYPEALAGLPICGLRPYGPRTPLRWAAFRLARSRAACDAYFVLLDLIEWARLRHVWVRGFRLAEGLAYAHGALAGGWVPGAGGEPDEVEIELTAESSLEPPAVAAPLVRVTVEGRPVASVVPRDGVWTGSLAEAIADAVEPEEILRVAVHAGWLEAPAAPSRRDEFEVVRLPGEGGAGGWREVAEEIGRGTAPLVAVPLGEERGPEWCEEALAAFDGERVGLCFGGPVAPGLPAAPLYLHDAITADATLLLADPSPAYMVLRRDIALALPATGTLPEAAIRAFEATIAAGQIVGHRDVRGIGPSAFDVTEWGAAYARLGTEALVAMPANQARRLFARRLGEGAAILGWSLLKSRGRWSPRDRRLAAGVLRGVLARSRGGRG